MWQRGRTIRSRVYRNVCYCVTRAARVGILVNMWYIVREASACQLLSGANLPHIAQQWAVCWIVFQLCGLSKASPVPRVFKLIFRALMWCATPYRQSYQYSKQQPRHCSLSCLGFLQLYLHVDPDIMQFDRVFEGIPAVRRSTAV